MTKKISFIIASFVCIGFFTFGGVAPTNASTVNPEIDGKISLLEAEHIALNEFAGVVKEHQLAGYDNRSTYEVEIRTESQDAKIEIDAFTGEIIDIDITQN